MRNLNFLLALLFLATPLTLNASEKKESSKKVEAKASTKKSAKVAGKKKRAVAEDSQMRVTPLDPYFPTDELKNYKVESEEGPVPPHIRDQYFQSAGLAEQVKGWDHFEKDMLLNRAKHESLVDVTNK